MESIRKGHCLGMYTTDRLTVIFCVFFDCFVLSPPGLHMHVSMFLCFLVLMHNDVGEHRCFCIS